MPSSHCRATSRCTGPADSDGSMCSSKSGSKSLSSWHKLGLCQPVRRRILQSGLDLLLKRSCGLGHALLLVLAQLANRMNLLDAVLAKSHLTREVRQAWHDVRFDVRTLRCGRTVQPGQDSLAKAGTGIRHGQCSTALAVLRVHHIRASILHMLVDRRNICSRDLPSLRILREKRQNRHTCMPTDDWDLDILRIRTCHLRNKLIRTHHVERRHTHNLLGVKPLLLAHVLCVD